MSALRVSRGFAWTQLYKMVEYGALVLYGILVSRHFGPEIGGNYAVYLAFTGTLGIISAFAVDGVLLRYVPRVARGELEFGHLKVEGVRHFMLNLFAFRLLVTLVICVFVALLLGVLPNLYVSFGASLGSIHLLWPWIVVFLIGQCAVSFATFTLIGLLQVKWVFYASLIVRFTMLGTGLLLLQIGNLSVEWAVALHALAAVLNGCLLLYWVNHHVEPHTSPGLRKEIRHLAGTVRRFVRKPGYLRVFVGLPFMVYGITTWGSDILTTVIGRQPDILMLRAILGENARDIGLYNTAASIVLMAEYIFLFGLGGTLVSVFSELAHQDEAGGSKPGGHFPLLGKARKDVAGFQAVMTAPLFGFMLVFTPLIVQVLYGWKFAGASPMVMLGLGITACSVVIFGGGMQVTSLVVIGKASVVFKNRLAWGVMNLIANYFLIRRFGGIGAMLGSQLANAGACATEGVLARRWIGSSFNPWRIAEILLIVSVSVLCSYGVEQILPHETPALVRLLIAAAIMVGLTAGGYILFRIPDARQVFDRMRALFMSKRERRVKPQG